jgi:CRISPR-associated protein Csd1
MLQLLVKYAQDHDLEIEPGFKPKAVRWAICFDKLGHFLDVVELGDVGAKNNSGQIFPRCPDLRDSELKAGRERKCHFLVESAAVVAVLADEGKAPDSKTLKKHDYFVQLLRGAADAMPSLATVADRLADPSSLSAIRGAMKRHAKLKPIANVTLRLGSEYPVESEAWHEWWRGFRRDLHTGRATAGTMRCFATGELAEPLETHFKVSGLRDVGGQPQCLLVSFDKDAFSSYNLVQSANASVSQWAASAYRAALDDLVKNHSIRLAGAKVVHWFQKSVPPEDDPLADIEEPREIQELNAQDRAKRLLEAIRTGKRADLATNFYYTMTVSGSGGRVMVRDWMEGQFETLVRNVSTWFDDLAIGNRNGSKLANSPGIERVITSLLVPRKPNQQYSDWIKPVGSERTALWRSAVRGDSIPFSVLARLVVLNTRFHVSGKLEDADKPENRFGLPEVLGVLYTRMGLLKACQIRKHRMHGGSAMAEEFKPYLNEQHPSIAYQCGRLMAVLAALQREGLGRDVGAGVVQRYYAAASVTPGLILGRLIRLSTFHLSSLYKDKPGLARWFEGRIAGIWGRIKGDPPRTLNLEEQSLFAMGYYQQLAQRFAGQKSEDQTENQEEKRE